MRPSSYAATHLVRVRVRVRVSVRVRVRIRVRGHARAADAEPAHHVGEGVDAQVEAGEADVVRARVKG